MVFEIIKINFFISDLYETYQSNKTHENYECKDDVLNQSNNDESTINRSNNERQGEMKTRVRRDPVEMWKMAFYKVRESLYQVIALHFIFNFKQIIRYFRFDNLSHEHLVIRLWILKLSIDTLGFFIYIYI